MRSIVKKTALLISLAISGISIVAILFYFSEKSMQKQNPFIRRYTPLAAVKTAEITLDNPYYYIAGQSGSSIFLANRKAPLYVTEIDTMLRRRTEHKIELDRYDFAFRSAEIHISPPYFYLFDGLVPVLYKGLLSDFKASVALTGKTFFTGAVIIDSARIAIRGQKEVTGENLMGLLSLQKDGKTVYHPELLEKQIDGLFDTSGTMSYSEELRQFVYVYYFRNQYIVADDNLRLIARGRTIDTTSKARLKIVKIESSGDRKLAAPPLTVNLNSTVSSNLLFINSGMMGRYEIPEVWKVASIVDVYDLKGQLYLLSFYIYDVPGLGKMRNFSAGRNAVYAVIGNQLHKYSFGKPIKNQLIKNNNY
ncbi:hypothetical protein [Flavobacterium sp. fv08]|uniref:hypothetical protein n=1 Tax=Flavobacterium sp. fv08 TaxID=1761784 RepID=UPI0008BE94B6|nr:hypothetical protein [Flavobacterium sp. fv08]SEP06298.1 hypothetical protein SAMN04487978_4356 [Flavobacterium sp. fv08]